MATSVQFANFELDLRSGELRRDKIVQKLQPQPAKVLALLVSRAGEVVTRQELAEQVWGSDTFVDFEQGLNFAIRQIRIVLDEGTEQPRFLETVPRKGYRFIATVVGISGPPQTSTSAIESLGQKQNGDTPPQPVTFRAVLKAIIACGLAAVLALYVIAAKPGNGNPAPVPLRSLVILPLQNLSGDPAQEYFADGMTDELTTQLAKIRSIRVTSRTSAMRYKGSQKLLAEIAHELKVDGIVEGSVVRSGNRLKLTAQLIDAATDRHLWAESYERDQRDIGSLQVEVAKDIAVQIRASLTSEEKTLLAKSTPVNPDAFEAYFKGRYFWNKRTQSDLKKALPFFQEAIDKDPTYAAAYVGLSDCYLAFASYSVLPAPEAYALAKAAAMKAIEIDGSLAEAHTPIAIIKAEYDWDFLGAEQEFRRAIALAPNSSRSHQFYAEDVLEPQARYPEANRELALAQQLDPSSLIIRNAAAAAYYLAREYDREIKQAHETLEFDANFPKAHQQLGRGFDQKGMHEEAIKEFQTAIALDPNPAYLADLARAFARAGKYADARIALAQLSDASSHKLVNSYSLAPVFVALGENDKALGWLKKAYEERNWNLIYLNVDPRLDPLRGDPRFQALVRQVGLVR